VQQQMGERSACGAVAGQDAAEDVDPSSSSSTCTSKTCAAAAFERVLAQAGLTAAGLYANGRGGEIRHSDFEGSAGVDLQGVSLEGEPRREKVCEVPGKPLPLEVLVDMGEVVLACLKNSEAVQACHSECKQDECQPSANKGAAAHNRGGVSGGEGVVMVGQGLVRVQCHVCCCPGCGAAGGMVQGRVDVVRGCLGVLQRFC
jgi:hypothetical protein